MRIIADLHLHSKYSRATSRNMNVVELARHAKLKGIDLLGTGDFTHPLWLAELKSFLTEIDYGTFFYSNVYFILTTEVACVFSKAGKLKKVHIIIVAPDFVSVNKINSALSKYGNLASDGRPTLSLSAKELVKIVQDISNDCLIIPAHIWTPWFSVFGSNSGFDKLTECFEEEIDKIYALETGLSSDPPMNWRLSCLDNFTLVSFSDSHSPANIGREATVFELPKLSYKEIIEAIKNKDKRVLFTIEFFPEEGKYHYDGHRRCNLRLSPKETLKYNNICPKCGKPITIGVMHRVELLADREDNFVLLNAPKYKRIIPLREILSKTIGAAGRISIEEEYNKIVKNFQNEFSVLLFASEDELLRSLPTKLAASIINIRNGKVNIEPGYDGVYGQVNLITEIEKKEPQQARLF